MASSESGRLIRRDGRATLEYRRRYNHPRERVWRALSEPEELAAWFPSTIDGERVTGAPLSFRFEGVQVDPMRGEMIRFDPPSLLEFSWGPDRVRFELAPDGDGTLLTLTVTLEVLGKATRDAAGWHQSLEGLERALAGDPTRTYDPDEWRSLRDAYAERFGPEASVLGPPREWQDEYGST